MNKEEKILIDIPLVLLISMFVVMGFLPRILGKNLGFIIGILIYWFIFCLPAVYLYTRRKNIGLVDLFKDGDKSVLNMLAFIPAVISFILVFIPNVKVVPKAVIFLALIVGIINGFIEEVFWRGMYNHATNNKDLAIMYPTVSFAIWHLAIYISKGISFQSGFIILLVGSGLLGLLWGYIMHRTGSLKSVVLANQLTSFFVLTEFIYINWFI